MTSESLKNMFAATTMWSNFCGAPRILRRRSNQHDFRPRRLLPMRHTLQVPRHPRSISTLLRKRPGTHTKHISRTPYSRACRPYPGKRLRTVPASTRRRKTISRALHALRSDLSTHQHSFASESRRNPEIIRNDGIRHVLTPTLLTTNRQWQQEFS